ncbi:MAG: DNA polymerase III subunit delta' [Thermodesulfobacteriota bacterium]|jgi:DNA polymerase-3 subunit delta'
MSFKKIKGQDRQIEILMSAIKSETVSHSYLFTGIPGIGKRTTATAIAKALNCETGNGDFCDCCIPCKKIEHRTHPDIFWIEPEGDYVKIDQIRKMQEQIKFTLYEGKSKVVIITNAQNMNRQSSNCLLKTLEEPPPHTVLFLLTTAPYQMLPTIRSRCQRVMFQPLSSELIVELLRKMRGGENRELKLSASLSGGSIGKAIQWMEGDALKGRKQLLEKFNQLTKGYVTEILDLAESLGEDKEVLVELLDLLRLWFRDILIFKETNQPTYLINKDLQDDVNRSASLLSCSDIFEKVNILTDVQLALHSNVNPRLAMESMLLQLCQ